jgi:hypothetical protein
LAERFARGNIEKVRRVGAYLHNGKIGGAQHQKQAVRLDATGDGDRLVLAVGEVDRFVHGSRRPYRLAER